MILILQVILILILIFQVILILQVILIRIRIFQAKTSLQDHDPDQDHLKY
jgi:type III secretory pathway component EscS